MTRPAKKFALTGAVLIILTLLSLSVITLTAADKVNAVLRVSGDVTVGSTLTAAVEGADDYEFSYTWTIGNQKVKGTEYTINAEDLEKSISVTATITRPVTKLSVLVWTPRGKLPVVHIDTDDGQPVSSRSRYVDGRMRIDLSDDTLSYENIYTSDYAAIEIRGRGNSTWGQAKKPYKIKLEAKADLFGMGENKHWALLANALDRSHLRNVLSYNLSGTLGMIYPKSIHVEVYFNGDYAGVYQLCENIRISKNRVNIYNWENVAEDIAAAIAIEEKLSTGAAARLETSMKENLSWVTTLQFDGYKIADYYDTGEFDISGGYLIEDDEYFDEFSKFRTSNGMDLMIKAPEFAATNDKMMEFIMTYMQDMEDAIYSKTRYNKDGKHYSEYMYVPSFVDFWMVNQAFKNVELLYKSCYMYKDVEQPVVFGPVWDFDWTSGNHMVLNPGSAAPTQWHHNESQDREYWYKALYSDPYFVVLLQDRWWEIRDDLDDMVASMDGYYDYLKEAVGRDNDKWGMGGRWTFEREVNELRDWLTTRLDWMDVQLKLRDPNILGMGADFTDKIEISVTDESGNALEKDTVSSFTTKSDYYYGGIGELSFSATVPLLSNKAEVYVNGILHSSYDSVKNGISVKINSRDLIKESAGHRNVITVMSYVGGDVSGVNYVSVTVKGAPTATASYLPGNTAATGQTQITNADEGETIILSHNAFRLSGYKFAGWTDGEKTYSAGSEYTIVRDTEFTATWEKSGAFPSSAIVAVSVVAVILIVTLVVVKRRKYFHLS